MRPEAVQVMAEIGIDISGHRSKPLDQYLGQAFDWLITVCDEAKEACPVLPGVSNQAHWSIDDPSLVTGSDDERLAAFRQGRDILRDRVHTFILAAGRANRERPVPTRLG